MNTQTEKLPLFDRIQAPAVAPKVDPAFDLDAGLAARDKGIEKAADHNGRLLTRGPRRS